MSPHAGVPLGLQLLLTVAFVVVVGMCTWTHLLYRRGQRSIELAPTPADNADAAWTWVFLVPALNEQVTIRDSVARLLALPVANRKVIVIDDGSDDRTSDILASFTEPDVHVLRRNLPAARQGKAAALNAAYHLIGQLLPVVHRARVIVVVVDADGRISPAAPRYAAAEFEDPAVGGVQALVRIYNRSGFLTRMQDLEFSIYGRIYQAGRNRAGTVGMGGNGQFNRLAALDYIADRAGPWRNRLTEDQDLGLRLLAAGWKSRQEVRAVVEQQGVPGLRALLRQRTRWSQGNLQAFALIRAMWQSPFPRLARAGEVLYLLMPVWQSIVGTAVVCAVALAAAGLGPILPPLELVPVVYVLGFSNSVLACLAARQAAGFRGWVRALGLGHLYAVYTWLSYPVLVRSIVRQLGMRRNWARTERVPLELSAG